MSQLNYQTIQVETRAVPSGPDRTKADGVAAGVKLLHKASVALNSFAISYRVNKELEALKPAIEKVMPSQGGVLVVVGIQEWATADFTGNKARSFMGLFIAGSGSSPESVFKRYRSTPSMVQGAPAGWVRMEEYVWVTSGGIKSPRSASPCG